MARVAALDANVGKLFCGVDREFGLVFLAAPCADDAAEFPFREAETADQVAASAVALRAQNSEAGFAIAEWTNRMSVAVQLQANAGTDKLSVRLKKSEGQEFLRNVGFRGRRPAV